MQNLKEKFKNILKKIKWSKSMFIVLILILLGGLFYWYQVRPSKLYTYCHKFALAGATYEYDKEKYNQDSYDNYYKMCLRLKGMNK